MSDSSIQAQPHKELHVAPMVDVTYREFRRLVRLLSRHVCLWTEMVVDETLMFNSYAAQYLDADEIEKPLIFQLGGRHPEWAAHAVQKIASIGSSKPPLQYTETANADEPSPAPRQVPNEPHDGYYSEVNLNMACPSNRVASERRCFGAALMKDVDAAIAMLQSMRQHLPSDIPVSVKTRIGVDDLEGVEEFLIPFIARLVDEGHCRRFYIHARKVYTQGLSPAKNRTVPPLNYEAVYRLCREFPECDFWINGGIRTFQEARDLVYGRHQESTHLHGTVPCEACNQPNGSCIAPCSYPAPNNLRGCLMGRAFMENPALLGDADRAFFGKDCNPSINRREVLIGYCRFLEEEIYPRRCSDHCDEITKRHPAPQVQRYRIACPVCQHVYGDGSIIVEETPDSGTKPKAKFTSYVVDRALKPVLGMFFGMKGAKTWKRTLDDLSRDSRSRNCGPGFLIREAILAMPEDLLDKPFIG